MDISFRTNPDYPIRRLSQLFRSLDESCVVVFLGKRLNQLRFFLGQVNPFVIAWRALPAELYTMMTVGGGKNSLGFLGQ